MNNKKTIGKVYLGYLFIGLILGFLFFRSAIIGPWTLEIHKLRIIAIEIVLIGVIPVVCALSKKVRTWTINKISFSYNFLKEHKMNLVKALIILAIATAFGIALHKILVVLFHFSNGNGGRATIMSAVYVTLTLFMARKSIWEHLAITFSVIALIIGVLFISVVTPLTGISWDDQIHYWNTLSLTQKIDGFISSADETMVLSAYDIGNAKQGLHKDIWSGYIAQMEKKYQGREQAKGGTSKVSISSVAYIPYALGILFGRSLGMNWTHVFDMGKVFNLLMYIGIFALAIRKIRYGKLFLALIGLIPTSLFMTCSYSYDPWLIAWTALGMSYFISFLQTPEKSIEMREYILMLVIFAVGCMPKAVYFPIILPALFIPSKRFKNSKQAFILRISVLAVFLLLIASFVLPIISAGGFGTGDARGGAAVNSEQQVQFILANPLETFKIFWNFIRDYILLDTNSASLNIVTSFCALGTGRGWTWVMMVLFAVGVMDREQKSLCDWKVRALGLIGLLFTVVLIVAALYVSFTAVGSWKIAGVQQRYLLPLIFPAFYFMGTPGNQLNREKVETAIVPIAFMSYLFIYIVYCLCVA